MSYSTCACSLTLKLHDRWNSQGTCVATTRGGGGGDDSNIKMPGCVCWVSVYVPILNDTLIVKTYPY